MDSSPIIKPNFFFPLRESFFQEERVGFISKKNFLSFLLIYFNNRDICILLLGNKCFYLFENSAICSFSELATHSTEKLGNKNNSKRHIHGSSREGEIYKISQGNCKHRIEEEWRT